MLTKESGNANAIEVLIADPDEVFRRRLHFMIEAQHIWRVCDEAADAIEAIQKAKRLDPHIVVMGLTMSRMDGLHAVRKIRRELVSCPGSDQTRQRTVDRWS